MRLESIVYDWCVPSVVDWTPVVVYNLPALASLRWRRLSQHARVTLSSAGFIEHVRFIPDARTSRPNTPIDLRPSFK